MEASGTTPPAEPAQPPPPPPPTTATEPKPGGAWRALAVILALALAFAAAVMIFVVTDLADTPIEKDCITPAQGGTCLEYYDGSSTAKTAQIVLSWASGILAGIAALVGLYFAVTGQRSRLLLQLTGAAIAFGAVSILIGAL